MLCNAASTTYEISSISSISRYFNLLNFSYKRPMHLSMITHVEL
jgi:hypothetical protein